MIIPEHWAEARVQRPRQKGQSAITVRRYGWSLTSLAEAEQMARQRAEQALQDIMGGKSLLRRSEPKVPYNGADGLPIREEVLSRQGDTVITRNSYGAHCLNTPDVLFADVDYETPPRTRTVGCLVVLLLVIGALLTAWFRSGWVFAGSVLAVLLLSYPLAVYARKVANAARGGAVQAARSRFDRFAQQHPDWHLRLYETPAGLRVLVLHRLFQPNDPEVGKLFAALGVDPVYVQMCRNQQCFRARVSPKPWRMNFPQHIRPRPGVWPVKAEHLPKRNAWIRDYEAAAEKFASCRFLAVFGNGPVEPKAGRVGELHDALSQALTNKPIA